jgi:hypothetical protein
VVEYLSSIHKALCSIPSTINKKNLNNHEVKIGQEERERKERRGKGGKRKGEEEK